MGADFWKKRVSQLSSDDRSDASEKLVPEGLCRKGCGLPVAAGLTRRGNAFTTCCRACAMGFGHDESCGSSPSPSPPATAPSPSPPRLEGSEPRKASDTLCRMGCGRCVAAFAG